MLEAVDKTTAYAWHANAPAEALALVLDVAEREYADRTPLGVSLTHDERTRARSLAA